MRKTFLKIGVSQLRKLLTLCLFLAPVCFAQQPLPNVTASGQLNVACTNTNSACSNGIVAGSGNAPWPPGANQGPVGIGSTLDVPVNNYSAATITIQGTYTGATINFEFSDSTGGVFYFPEICARTDINVLEASEAVPNNATRAWQCPVWGAYRFRVRLNAISTGTLNVTITETQAAIDPSLVVAASPPVIPGTTDPCQDLSQQKSSVSVNISTATTTQIVPLSGSTTIYVCGYQLVAGAGTNPSIQFEYGTGAACVTSPVVLTGAMATGVTVSTTAAGPILTAGNDVSLFKSAAGNALCLVSGGTTPNWQGFVTYVQQ